MTETCINKWHQPESSSFPNYSFSQHTEKPFWVLEISMPKFRLGLDNKLFGGLTHQVNLNSFESLTKVCPCPFHQGHSHILQPQQLTICHPGKLLSGCTGSGVRPFSTSTNGPCLKQDLAFGWANKGILLAALSHTLTGENCGASFLSQKAQLAPRVSFGQACTPSCRFTAED